MSELEMLTARARQLEADRDALQTEIEEARARLEEERAEVDARTKRLANRRRTRRSLITIAVVVVLVVGAATTWTALRWFEEETLRAEVTDVHGPAPVSPGEACVLRLARNYGPYNADLVVQCGDLRLYGFESFGALDCEVEDGRAVRCADDDTIAEGGDPRVRLDRASGTLAIDDEPRWGITLALR
ncbi:MAG TPA: hypothetical protein RMH99_03560 [Sandaracinaceae bacterium LLY-WYZ-13_1]|nr:hypothetical protein [Sandaracinaceae bacterium LLY-WYZ-13_1]